MRPDNMAYGPPARLLLAVAFVLMVPLVAMQFTNQVVWDLVDFTIAGVLLFGVGLMYQLATRKGRG